MRGFLLGSFFLAGCFIDAPHFVASDSDGGACTPGCNGDVLTTCSGDTPTQTTCDLGCGETGTPHCLEVVPSNGVALTELDGVTAALSTPSGEVHTITISSDDGTITDTFQGSDTTLRDAGTGVNHGIRFSHSADDKLGILSVAALTVTSAAILRVDGVRPLVILSSGDVELDGVVDISAHAVVGSCGSMASNWTCPGPGGGFGGGLGVAATGCGGGGTGQYLTGANEQPGGGGGALAVNGADSGTTAGRLGVGGAVGGCPGATLIPLEGGSGGGASQVDDGGANLVSGGGGGGALQITSLTRISSTITGQLDASGAGGARTPGGASGGGGGGAGGAVLLEAPIVDVSNASVFAGGGGGGTGQLPSSPGTSPPSDGNGEKGRRSNVAASGGDAPSGVGHGGDGGIYLDGSPVAPQAGDPGTTGTGTGGGGGSEGIVRINAVPGQIDITGFRVTGVYSSGDLALQ